jgi:hypothetical protein
MLNLLRFVESDKNYNRILSWCCYVPCTLCGVVTVVMWAMILTGHR